MTNSRRKGKDGELEVARILKARGLEASRGCQYHGGPDSPDVVGLPGFHIEVKRTETFNLYKAMEQACRDRDGAAAPVVVHRRSRQPWVAVLLLDDFLDLYDAARGGDGGDGE